MPKTITPVIRLTIEMDPGLKAQFKSHAAAEKLSLKKKLIQLIEKYIHESRLPQSRFK